MKKLDNQLEALLLQKPFAALNEEEKKYALSQLSESEYGQFRTTLLASQALFKADQSKPAVAVKGNLTTIFKNKKAAKRSPLAKVIGLKIPAWQAAAAMIGLLCFFNFNRPTETQIQIVQAEPEKIYITKTDTIYKEVIKEIPTKFVNTKTKKRTPKKAPVIQKESAIAYASETVETLKNTAQTIDNQLTTNTPSLKTPTTSNASLEAVVNKTPIGRTVKDDDELTDFLGKVY